MAKTVTVEEWCDMHWAQDERVPSTWSGPMRIGDYQTDDDMLLCGDCHEAYVLQIETLLQDIGSIIKGTRTASIKFGNKPKTPGPEPIVVANAVGRFDCPECGNDYKNRGSLNGHMVDNHGHSLAEWEAEQRGEDRPTFVCEECIKDGIVPPFEARAKGGLGKHKLDKHGIPGQADSTLRRKAAIEQREPALV